MPKDPEILRVETLAKTRIFHVEQLDLRFSNGVEVQYERLRSAPRGAVLVVPMLDADTVLLIREYAAGVERYELAGSTGNPDTDKAINQALANLPSMHESPPEDMPQPVKLRVTSRF